MPAAGREPLTAEIGQLAAEPSVIRAWVVGFGPELSDSYVRTLFASLSAA